MFTIVISIIVIVSLLLILVVLAQSSKGGVGSTFGGGASQVVGVKRTTDFLEKLTWGLVIVLMVLTVSTKLMISDPLEDSGIQSPNIQRAQEQTVLPSLESGEVPPVNENTENLDQLRNETLEELGNTGSEEENQDNE
jgi:preprotein translocase subunit SecG